MNHLPSALLCALLFAIALPIHGQKIKSNTVISVPTGPDTVTFTVDKGETISKNGVVIKFGPEFRKDGVLTGYLYEQAGIDALKVGDHVPLFIRGLAYGIGYGGAKDDTGAKVFWGTFAPTVKGAFKPVTIESMKRQADVLTIGFIEEAILDDKTKVKEIRLALTNGWYSAVK